MSPDDFKQFNDRLTKLERLFYELYRNDRYLIKRKLVLSDGVNIEAGTSEDEFGAGSSFGTSPTQKIGFHGNAIIQQGPLPAFSLGDVSGTGDDGQINSNFDEISSWMDDVQQLLEDYGLAAES